MVGYDGNWHRRENTTSAISNYADNINLTEITSTYKPCKHDKGWYDTIGRWWGRQQVFVCEKCMSILDKKTLKRL
jgi:hypothetical protein